MLDSYRQFINIYAAKAAVALKQAVENEQPLGLSKLIVAIINELIKKAPKAIGFNDNILMDVATKLYTHKATRQGKANDATNLNSRGGIYLSQEEIVITKRGLSYFESLQLLTRYTALPRTDRADFDTLPYIMGVDFNYSCVFAALLAQKLLDPLLTAEEQANYWGLYDWSQSTLGQELLWFTAQILRGCPLEQRQQYLTVLIHCLKKTNELPAAQKSSPVTVAAGNAIGVFKEAGITWGWLVEKRYITTDPEKIRQHLMGLHDEWFTVNSSIQPYKVADIRPLSEGYTGPFPLIQELGVNALSLPADPGCLAIYSSIEAVLVAVGYGNTITVYTCPKDAQGRVAWQRDGNIAYKAQTIANGGNPVDYARVDSIAFAKNGTQVVAGYADGKIRIWNYEREWRVAVLPGLAHPASVIAHNPAVANCEWKFTIAVSPDGKRIVSSARSGMIVVWNLVMHEGKETWIATECKGHEQQVNRVAFSPDGRRFVSGSDDKTLRLWGDAGKAPVLLSGHTNAISSVAFATRWADKSRREDMISSYIYGI